jgi:phosphate transport system substrate-binding protein
LKRAISIILLLTFLLPSIVSVAAPNQDTAIKQTIKTYFDLRYQILSSLTYNNTIRNLINPEVNLKSSKIITEADVLDTQVKYRKAQMNDMSYKTYNFSLTYISNKINGNTTTVLVDESSEFYFKCAPTVRNQLTTRHIINLKFYKDKWYITSDEYTDNDGIKVGLMKHYLKNGKTIEDAKKDLLTELASQGNKRLDKLSEIASGFDDKNIIIMHAGKSIGYLVNKPEKLNTQSSLVPISIDKIYLIPEGAVTERLAIKVKTDKKSGMVLLECGERKASAIIGKKVISVDNKQIQLKTPFKLQNDKLLIPLNAIEAVTGRNTLTTSSGIIIISKNTIDKSKTSNLITALDDFYNVLFTKSDFPRIDGSTATYPLSMELGKELLGLDETGVKGFITHNTTHNAYVNLIDKKADIVFVTQPSTEELKLAKKKKLDLEVVPICREGFVFLVNSENSITGLTSAQIQDIYQGKIKNWVDVGGEDMDIIPYQRPQNSGSQTVMEAEVMKGKTMLPPPQELIIAEMGQLIDKVADFSNAKNALGFSFYYYATNMYQNRNIKLLKIDGVMPDKSTIKSGKYPFKVAYYAVLRKSEPQNSNARKLLNWLLGSEGQKVVEKAGFVSVK